MTAPRGGPSGAAQLRREHVRDPVVDWVCLVARLAEQTPANDLVVRLLLGLKARTVSSFFRVYRAEALLLRLLLRLTFLPFRGQRRLAAIRALSEAGVPVGYLQAPMIPALTDSEAPAIAQAAAKAGAKFSGYVVLRLPFAVKLLFEQWLEQHYPGKKEKILNRIRSMRAGKLNDPNFKSRMRGEGIFAEQMAELAPTKIDLRSPLPRPVATASCVFSVQRLGSSAMAAAYRVSAAKCCCPFWEIITRMFSNAPRCRCV